MIMYGYESWTIKKAEHWRTDAFELWCWRWFLRVPWTARRSNQSILKEISPEYSLEGLMLKLKLQYFGHLIGRTDSLEKTLVLGKTEGRRRRGWQRMRWLDGIMELIDMSLSKLQSWWWTGKPGMLQSMGSHSQTQLSDWTELNYPDVPEPFIEWSVFSPLTCNTIFIKFLNICAYFWFLYPVHTIMFFSLKFVLKPKRLVRPCYSFLNFPGY